MDELVANKAHQDRKEPRSSPLPHHPAYGSVPGGSADPRKRDCSADRQYQIQGNKSPSDVKKDSFCTRSDYQEISVSVERIGHQQEVNETVLNAKKAKT